jgi:large subunit ribosomal protein L21
MTSVDGNISIGNPNVTGASVTAEVVENGKDKKIVVFKYKAKTRYRRKNGHRQQYTDLRVTDISLS